MTDMQNLMAGMVRPLEWTASDRADVYSVNEGYGQSAKAFFLSRGTNIIGHFDTANEARLSAQADYTVRILTAMNPDAVLALVAPQCCMCGKTGLSTVEGDGGAECQLSDGRWVCSSSCYSRACDDPLALVAAAYADAAGEIHKTIDECAAFDDKHGAQVLQRLADCLSQRTVPTNATAALARMLADAQAKGLEMAAVKADAARQKYAIATYQSDDGRLQNAARCYCADEIAIDIRAMKGEGA